MLPLTAINQKKEVEFHLSRYCQIVANMFGKAEDFLEVLGLDDPMADQITELATQFALMKYNKRFIQPWKVLCDTLKEGFRHYLDNQRAQLDLLEK